MKHAGPAALASVADLLTAARASGAKEPRPGVFYRKGRAWLHFHEDPAGLFADLRIDAEWRRLCVSDAAGRADLLALLNRNC